MEKLVACNGSGRLSYCHQSGNFKGDATRKAKKGKREVSKKRKALRNRTKRAFVKFSMTRRRVMSLFLSLFFTHIHTHIHVETLYYVLFWLFLPIESYLSFLHAHPSVYVFCIREIDKTHHFYPRESFYTSFQKCLRLWPIYIYSNTSTVKLIHFLNKSKLTPNIFYNFLFFVYFLLFLYILFNKNTF